MDWLWLFWILPCTFFTYILFCLARSWRLDRAFVWEEPRDFLIFTIPTNGINPETVRKTVANVEEICSELKMKCLVLAGGFGTRLSLNNRAKALLEYKDKPLLTHIVEKLPEGIPILISINRRFESDFYQWQEKHRDRGIEILVESARSEEEKLGAVSALNFWIGQKGVTEDLMVIGGDNYFGFNLSEFITAYDGKNPLVAVYDIREISRASQFGVVRLDGNRIVELQEKPTTPKSGLVSTACISFL